jgi:hypothetical protein
MAFSATVISPMKNPERISRSLGIFAGKVNIDSYATTLVTLTGITKFFKPTSNATTGGFGHGIISVQIEGPSSNGYLVRWDYTTGAFKCYYPLKSTSITLPVDSNVGAGAALLFASGGGAGALHATSAVGNITYAQAAGAALELVANVDVGTFGFVAIGFV